MYVRTCTTYHQVMPVPDLPTTVLVGKYVDTATDSYFSAVFWCQQFFYVCSVNKDTLAKVGISRTLGNKNCIASINRNIQIWIQMNETSKKKIGSISRCLDPHLDRHEKPYTYAYEGRMLCTWNTPISMSIYLNSRW